MKIKSAQVQAFFFRDFPNAHFPEILDEIYVKAVYKPFVEGKRDMVIADWGANQGLTSFYFKDYAKQVYAVEPSQQHIEVLNKMVEFNGMKNVKVCPYAISNENGKTKFYHSPNVTMFSLSDKATNPQDFEEVETVDPETFFKREGIEYLDLLKLDVEGTESKVVCSDSFAKIAPKIKVIVGEHHNWDTQRPEAFAHTLESLGFEFKWDRRTSAQVFTAIRI